MPTGIYIRKPFSERHKRKISETRKRLFKKGILTLEKNCVKCFKKGHNVPQEWKDSWSRKLKGRTKETHEGNRRQAEKLRGRTKETHKGIRRRVEKIRGRTKETHEYLRKMAEKRKGICSGKLNPMYGVKGEKAPNWRGGKSFEPYGIKFNEELREYIRRKYLYRCQQCFRHQDELRTKSGRKYKLHIHHIDFNKQNNSEDNLIPLCRNCHTQTYFNREDWIKYFQDKIKVSQEN